MSKPRLEVYTRTQERYTAQGYRTPRTAVQLMVIDDLLERRYSPDYETGIGSLRDVVDTSKNTAEMKVAAWFQRETAKEDALRREIFLTSLIGWWRGSLLAAALVLLLFAGLVRLRLVPRRSAAGRMGECLSQLVRSWACVPAAAGLAVAGAGAGLWCLTLAIEFSELTTLSRTVPLLGALAALTFVVAAARREVARRSAFLGLRPRGAFRPVAALVAMTCSLAALCAVAGLLIGIGGPGHGKFPGGWPAATKVTQVVTGLGTVPLVWIGVSALLGYTSPAANLRHRLVAVQLLPAVLVMSAVFAALAIFSQPVERSMAEKAGKELLGR